MAEGSEETTWVVPPPAPGGANVHLQIHPDAQLSSEFKQALDQLMQALAAEESVQGYANPAKKPAPSCDEVINEPNCSGGSALVMCRIRPLLGPRL
jgi:hypothetical protein